MKITETKTECTFGDVGIGDVFKWDNDCYIKIKPIKEADTEDLITAVHLETGYSCYMKYGTKVTPVVAELTVKEL